LCCCCLVRPCLSLNKLSCIYYLIFYIYFISLWTEVCIWDLGRRLEYRIYMVHSYKKVTLSTTFCHSCCVCFSFVRIVLTWIGWVAQRLLEQRNKCPKIQAINVTDLLYSTISLSTDMALSLASAIWPATPLPAHSAGSKGARPGSRRMLRAASPR
jgi:hypothetical protein